MQATIVIEIVVEVQDTDEAQDAAKIFAEVLADCEAAPTTRVVSVVTTD